MKLCSIVVATSRRSMYDNDVGDRATLAMVNYEERTGKTQSQSESESELQL